MYEVKQIWHEGQDGNQGVSVRTIGSFDTEQDAIDCIAVQVHNGWVEYEIIEA